VNENEKLCALFSAHLQALKIFDGKEAISLFLKSTRIKDDLEMCLKQLTDNTTNNDEDKLIPIKVIIREWKEITIENEFRGFVFNKQLTALSQYFDTCYFETLKQNNAAIEKTLKQFFEDKIRPRIQFKNNFIIDFCITTNKEVLLIELNPFLTTTDSVLFSWKNDKKILTGEKEFEFRVLERPIKNLQHCVISPWKHFFV